MQPDVRLLAAVERPKARPVGAAVVAVEHRVALRVVGVEPRAPLQVEAVMAAPPVAALQEARPVEVRPHPVATGHTVGRILIQTDSEFDTGYR